MLRGAGVPGEERDQRREVRGAAEGVLDVAGVAQEVLGGRPGEEHDHRLAAGEMPELRRLAGGALDCGVGAVDVDQDVLRPAGGERGFDLGEPGGGLGAGVAAVGDGRGLVHPDQVEERPVAGVGAGGPFLELIEGRAFLADPERGGAEVQPAVGGDGIDPVVARADRQAAGGIEEADLAAGGEVGGEIEDARACVLEEERRRHQPHRRMVEDEEGSDAGRGDHEEEDPAQHASLPRRFRSGRKTCGPPPAKASGIVRPQRPAGRHIAVICG